MPDAFEFPRMLRAVVPLMRARHAVIDELVADWLPGFAAVVRALHLLTKPTARLRGVEAVRINRRALEMVHFPPGKMRLAHGPIFALSIRGQDESAFARTHQQSYSAHGLRVC